MKRPRRARSSKGAERGAPDDPRSRPREEGEAREAEGSAGEDAGAAEDEEGEVELVEPEELSKAGASEPREPTAAEGDELPDFLEEGASVDEKEQKSRALVRRDGRAPSIADPLTRYIEEVKRFEPLEREEEQELARRYREEGDGEAARRLASANLMLVVKLALMYRRAIRNVMDLIQEGNIGLMEALKRYDPEQGVRFSTYAAWWIKAYILKYLMDNARLVRVGTTNARRKLLYNLRREQRKLEAQGIRPTPRLLAEHFGVSEDDVKEVDQALASPDLSVDAPLTEEGDFTAADVLAEPGQSAEEQVIAGDLRTRIEAAIADFRQDLDERDCVLLDERLVADEAATLAALGERFGVTREAMRQAEAKLKRRLAVFLRERLGDEVILHFSAGQ